MKRIRPWTTLEVRRLLDLRSQRYSLAGMARALNRTVIAVSRKLNKLGVRVREHRRKPGELQRAVRSLCRPGRSDLEIAVALGVSQTLVFRVRRSLGIPAGLTYADAGRRNARTVRKRPACWCCGKRCPYVTVRNGWQSRTVWHVGRETYCPGCFARWGWPTVPHGKRANPAGADPLQQHEETR